MKLLAVKSDTYENHFRAWPKEYESDRWKNIVKRAGISKNNLTHSYRFHHLFQELYAEMKIDPEVREVFSILDVVEGPEIGKKNGADLVIIHKKWFHRKRTLVSITDKYRKREIEPSNEVFTLNIQKWTDENCINFEKFGKKLTISHWERHVNQIKEAVRAKEEAERDRMQKEKEAVANQLIDKEMERRTLVNKKKLNLYIPSVLTTVKKDSEKLGEIINNINHKIKDADYEEIIRLKSTLNDFKSELAENWSKEKSKLNDVRRRDEVEIKCKYVKESDLDWIGTANSEPDIIHSLDYYNKSELSRIKPEKKHFFQFSRDLRFFYLSFRDGRYTEKRVRIASISISRQHPLENKIYDIKEELERKSRVIFEGEFPGLMWWARKHKITMKEELQKYIEGPHQSLRNELEQLKAKGSSRTQKEEERAYMLEWSLIGESWGETKELRRMIDLPDVEHAMRRYHEDDEVTEK